MRLFQESSLQKRSFLFVDERAGIERPQAPHLTHTPLAFPHTSMIKFCPSVGVGQNDNSIAHKTRQFPSINLLSSDDAG